ncbi:MAG: CHAT domain-containing protein [Cyanobacteria bacterium P01_A01_bin.123]
MRRLIRLFGLTVATVVIILATQIPGFSKEPTDLQRATLPLLDGKPSLEKSWSELSPNPLPTQRQVRDLAPAALKTNEDGIILQTEGSLAEGDSTLQDGSLYDSYPFEGQTGQIIQIRLESVEFDTYLILLAPNGEQLAFNDDSLGGTNSRISVELPQDGTYRVIANAYDSSGRGEYSLMISAISDADYRQAVDIETRKAGADRLLALGFQHYSRSQYPEALTAWEEALSIYQAIGDRFGEGQALNNLGLVYDDLGQYGQAIDLHEQSLVIAREMGDRITEGYALGNLGLVYDDLGQYERAIDFHQQSLAIEQELGNRRDAAGTLSNLGGSYYRLGQYDRAIDFLQQSLVIQREVNDRAREGTVLGNLGFAYYGIGQYEQSIDLHQQHLTIAREVGDPFEEARALNNLGFAHQALDDYEQALDLYQQSIAIFRNLGVRNEEGIALGRLGRLLDQQDQSELAIVFLKASVEVRESIRGDISGLDTELQQSFIDTVADDYRLLADLLLQQDRIIEAQRILDLLKVQELDDYLQDVQRNGQTEQGVDYWQPEASILALYQEVLLTGQELAQLQRLDATDRTPAEQTRLEALEANQDQLYTNFIDWLEEPQIIAALDQLRAETRGRNVDIENFTDLQTSLANLPQTSVLLYPLILDDRLELVLISPNAPPVRYPVEVSATELNRVIVAFGQALKSPTSDARTPAQQLYDWVIKPLETDLAAANAETIVFAPDGVLRYVPLPALYDGENWLAERFNFTQITAASVTDFDSQPSGNLDLLAAACAACQFSFQVGDGEVAFNNLPGTADEVALLSEQFPEAEVLLNDRFTPDELESRLGDHTLVHLATHGMFVPGQPDESFLVFGDGSRVNLRQIRRDWNQLDADLVVLSACETAVGSPQLGDGIEVLGLGFQMQRVGAKAVIASLWQVSDRGTQIFMGAFYDALRQGMTKAEALRWAQTAFINNDETVLDAQRAGIAIRVDEGRDTGDAGTLSHPYFWAPFILIGNGL